MSKRLELIRQNIITDPANKVFSDRGWLPLYTASEKAEIVIVGQAPGRVAQTTNIPWNDKSGDMLRSWLGVDRDTFYNPNVFSLIPMDFYYPGKGTHGDLPPRKDFAQRWHPQILAAMPNVRLIILIGAYSQKYYLGTRNGRTLTETIRQFTLYLPQYFPLVHPSPLNFRWQAKNPWFAEEVIPELQSIVRNILKT